jgi:hypothetical protein
MMAAGRRPTMNRMLRHAVRLALVLCIPAFLWIPGNTQPGRDFARCTQACGSVRLLCHDRCQQDCQALYETDEEREACLLSCDAVCVVVTQECKLWCNLYVLKGNEPPMEP